MNKMDEISKNFDKAEFLKKEVDKLKIKIENWDLENITQKNLVSSSLRVIKENKFGSNYTFGNSERTFNKLIAGARESAYYGEEAKFDFSRQKLNKKSLFNKDKFGKNDGKKLFGFIKDLLYYIEQKEKDITFNLRLNKSSNKISLKTTNQAELFEKNTNYQLRFGAPVPGGGSQISRTLEQDAMFEDICIDEINDFLRDYRNSYETSSPKTGNMPVLFSPNSLYFLFVSLNEGVSGKKVYQNISPLVDKRGEKIFSEKLFIVDKPHMKKSSSRRYFDDEGIKTDRTKIIDEGVLKNYIYDLEYSEKMKVEPTGNGLKKALFQEDISVPVTPSFINPVIETGNKTKKQLLSEIDEGIYVTNVIGFHSSNYEQGHFSVQAQGFHVKNGILQGRLQDVMMAGNIYNDFNNVIGIGNKLYPSMFGYAPYLLLEKISVTGR